MNVAQSGLYNKFTSSISSIFRASGVLAADQEDPLKQTKAEVRSIFLVDNGMSYDSCIAVTGVEVV